MYGYIYLILNKVNGKTYVGKHKSSKRWFEDNYMGSGTSALKPAKEKYGIENFEKFFIQYCYSLEELNCQEQFWIAHYRSLGKAEYNISDGGEFGYTKGFLHKHHSEETKKKISESGKCKHNHKGKNNPRYGKKWTEEQRKMLSESHKKHPNKVWNKGIKRTDLVDTQMVYENPETGKRNTRQGWLLSGIDVYYRKFIKVGRLRDLNLLEFELQHL